MTTRTSGVGSFWWIGFGVVVLHRFGINIGDGGLPVNSVVLPLLLVALLVTRRAGFEPWRTALFLIFVSGAVGLTIATAASLSSLALVIAMWAPFCVAVREPRRAQHEFVAGVVAATVVAAGLGVLQSVWSGTTGRFLDPFAAMPRSLMLSGYNTTDPISFGSTWMKSNGVFFLEASFLSLMAMTSIVMVASGAVGSNWSNRRRALTIGTLSAGLFSAVAASGVVLLPVLIAILLAGGHRRVLYSVAGFAVGLYVLSATPVWDAFSRRVLTVDLEAGSNSARLVRPYTELLVPWLHQGNWWGNGPGSASAYTRNLYVDWRNEITTPTAVKMLYEYGLLGLVILVAIVVAVLTASKLNAYARVALVIVFVIPTDGLTNGLLVALVCMCSLPSMRANSCARNAGRYGPELIGEARRPKEWELSDEKR